MIAHLQYNREFLRPGGFHSEMEESERTGESSCECLCVRMIQFNRYALGCTLSLVPAGSMCFVCLQVHLLVQLSLADLLAALILMFTSAMNKVSTDNSVNICQYGLPLSLVRITRFHSLSPGSIPWIIYNIVFNTGKGSYLKFGKLFHCVISSRACHFSLRRGREAKGFMLFQMLLSIIRFLHTLCELHQLEKNIST